MLPNNIYQITLSNVLMHINLCLKNKSKKLGIGIVLLDFIMNLITYLMSHFVVPGTKYCADFYSLRRSFHGSNTLRQEDASKLSQKDERPKTEWAPINDWLGKRIMKTAVMQIKSGRDSEEWSKLGYSNFCPCLVVLSTPVIYFCLSSTQARGYLWPMFSSPKWSEVSEPMVKLISKFICNANSHSGKWWRWYLRF